MRCLIAFLVITGALMAQPRFSATTGDVALVGTEYKFTIQQPASATKAIKLEVVQVYCSVACDISQSQTGTAATATAGTVRGMPPENAAPTATVFTASDVGTGTPVGGVIHRVSAGTDVLDLSKIVLVKGSTKANYTVTIGALSGTVNITYFWSEQ